MQKSELPRRTRREALFLGGALLAWLTAACKPITRYPIHQAPDLSPVGGLPRPELTIEQALTPTQAEIDFMMEQAAVPDALENLTGYRTALILLQRYFDLTGEPEHKGVVGWIDVTRLTADHPAFANSIDFERSRNFAPGTEGTGVAAIAAARSEHANLALQFCTEVGTDGTAGLAQPPWCEVLFTTIYDQAISPTPDSLHRCAAVITYLVDNGAGVIGIIPTWWETQTDQESMDAFLKAVEYARIHNVIVVLAGGNMGVDLGFKDIVKRPLHDAVAQGDDYNFWTMGGVNEYGERAVWDGEGSNYGVHPETGRPYMTFVSQAVNRLVPGVSNNGFITWRGTTFTTGEMAAAIASVQAILGKDEQGRWPDIGQVMRFFTETSEMTSDPQLARFGIPQYDRAVSTAIREKLR